MGGQLRAPRDDRLCPGHRDGVRRQQKRAVHRGLRPTTHRVRQRPPRDVVDGLGLVSVDERRRPPRAAFFRRSSSIGAQPLRFKGWSSKQPFRPTAARCPPGRSMPERGRDGSFEGLDEDASIDGGRHFQTSGRPMPPATGRGSIRRATPRGRVRTMSPMREHSNNAFDSSLDAKRQSGYGESAVAGTTGKPGSYVLVVGHRPQVESTDGVAAMLRTLGLEVRTLDLWGTTSPTSRTRHEPEAAFGRWCSRRASVPISRAARSAQCKVSELCRDADDCRAAAPPDHVVRLIEWLR